MAITSEINQNTIVLKEKDKEVLIITEALKDDVIEMQLEGELRNDVKHYLGDEMKALILLKKDLKIDMRNVTYLSSACSEVLLNIQRTIDENEKGSMCLFNIPANIMSEMKETGLAELLMIEKTGD